MDPREFVEKYCIKSIACCFSGGRSSLAAAHYILSELEAMPVEKHILFVDTGVMIPSAEPYVRKVSEQFGWPLEVLKPEVDFWQYAEKYGVPTPKRRWCCYRLKLQPIFDFVRKMPSQRAVVLGLRGDESSERRRDLSQVKYDRRRNLRAWMYLPLMSWTRSQVKAYIKKQGLPDPPHYRQGLRETCMCGAFTTGRQARIIRGLFPEFFEKFVELEGKFRRDWSVFWDHGPLYAKDLAKQDTIEGASDPKLGENDQECHQKSEPKQSSRPDLSDQ